MLCHSWYGPDVWYHLSWGRSLIERWSFTPETHTLLQQPLYANMYWLFQVVLYEIYDGFGLLGGSLFFALAWVLIAWGWLGLTRAWTSSVLAPGLFLMAICGWQLRFEQRPEVISYLILVVMLSLIAGHDFSKRLSRARWACLLGLEVLWVNTHGYFVFGPLLMLAVLVSVAIESRSLNLKNYSSAAEVLVGLVVVTFINPFGWHVWEAVEAYSEVSRGLREVNAELMAPDWFHFMWPVSAWAVLMVVSSIWSVYQLLSRRGVFGAVLALAGAVLWLQASRNLPLYLILSAMAWGSLIARTEEWIQTKTPELFSTTVFFAPSFFALILSINVYNGDYFRQTFSLATFGIHLERASYPIGAVDFLKKLGFQGKLFNDSYDGGYLEYHLPGVQVTGDSYFSDVETTLGYFKAIREPASFARLENQFQFDGLVINVENQDLIESVWRDPKWNLVYADSHRVLYLRRSQSGNLSLKWQDVHFFEGEDLRHWVYMFGVTTWAGMALTFQDLDLLKQLIFDLRSSRWVPSTVIRYAAGAAIKTRDRELFNQTMGYLPRMFESNAGDLAKIRELSGGFNP